MQQSPEEIQARLADFAAETLHNPGDISYIFDNIGYLALSTDFPKQLDRLIVSPEYIFPRSHYGDTEPVEPLRIEAGTNRLIATSEEYDRFLRDSLNGRTDAQERIKSRAQFLSAFHQYEPKVAPFAVLNRHQRRPEETPNYIGSGSNSDAYLITQGGQELVAKMSKSKLPNPKEIDDRMRVGYLTKGHPHVEQVVAASYEKGVIITEKMSGTEICNINPEELAAVTDAQLEDLIDTLVFLEEKILVIDPKPSNIFYDTKEGFGIIDVQVMPDYVHGIFLTVTDVARSLAYGWVHFGAEKDDEYSITANLEVAKELANRFKNSVQKKLHGQAFLPKLISQIDQIIEEAAMKPNNSDIPESEGFRRVEPHEVW